MHRCIVRRAVPEDAVAICDLHKASVRSLCAGAYSPEQIEAWLAPRRADDYRKAMTVGGEMMFVGECARRIVGFASIKASMLTGLYVDPDMAAAPAGFCFTRRKRMRDATAPPSSRCKPR